MSASIRSVDVPALAQRAARWAERVVFPSPPVALVIITQRPSPALPPSQIATRRWSRLCTNRASRCSALSLLASSPGRMLGSGAIEKTSCLILEESTSGSSTRPARISSSTTRPRTAPSTPTGVAAR